MVLKTKTSGSKTPEHRAKPLILPQAVRKDVTPLPPIPIPLHYQVRDFLLREIAEGRLCPGDKLPTETQLMERFGVSRTPVRQAMLDLVHRGLVQRRGGKGTFVGQ